MFFIHGSDFTILVHSVSGTASRHAHRSLLIDPLRDRAHLHHLSLGRNHFNRHSVPAGRGQACPFLSRVTHYWYFSVVNVKIRSSMTTKRSAHSTVVLSADIHYVRPLTVKLSEHLFPYFETRILERFDSLLQTSNLRSESATDRRCVLICDPRSLMDSRRHDSPNRTYWSELDKCLNENVFKKTRTLIITNQRRQA